MPGLSTKHSAFRTPLNQSVARVCVLAKSLGDGSISSGKCLLLECLRWFTIGLTRAYEADLGNSMIDGVSDDDPQSEFIPPIPRPFSADASLLIQGRRIGVFASLHETTDLRDRRIDWAGTIWCDDMPLDVNLNGPMLLSLSNGGEDTIKLINQVISPTSSGRVRLRAEFSSTRNLKDE